MNCAFAIGRLCDYEEGRDSFLKLNKEMYKLISMLTIMIEQNQDYGCNVFLLKFFILFYYFYFV